VQVSDLTPSRLRALAEIHPDHALVWTLYVNLDPSQFATPKARTSEVHSLLDAGNRLLEDVADDLDHAEKTALREDLGRLRELLEGDGLPTEGAHGVAVFCSGPAGLLEALRLPRPVPSEVLIDRTPQLGPLVDMAAGGAWAVFLVNRRLARILRGDAERLEEVARVKDRVHGQHDQGGWSQARYQRSVHEDVRDHLQKSAAALDESFRRRPFDHLLVSTPDELWGEVEDALDPQLRDRVAGRFYVDVEQASPDDVLEEARGLMEEEDRRRERAALDRLRAGIARPDGHGAAGLADVLEALTERRVETLLLAPGHAAPGSVCPRDGWMGPPAESCPVDGGPVENREDITDDAIESALAQSAEVMRIRHSDDLERLGGIAAILRF
jgi:peptide chain release factor subunit 1